MTELGRPALTDEELDVIFRKMEPYLKMGLSIPKACLQANVPKSTVYDHMKMNVIFSERIDTARNYMAILTSSAFYTLIGRILEKIQNKKKPTRSEVNLLKWYSLKSKVTKEEFGNRTEEDLNIKELPEPILKIINPNVLRDDSNDKNKQSDKEN